MQEFAQWLKMTEKMEALEKKMEVVNDKLSLFTKCISDYENLKEKNKSLEHKLQLYQTDNGRYRRRYNEVNEKLQQEVATTRTQNALILIAERENNRTKNKATIKEIAELSFLSVGRVNSLKVAYRKAANDNK